MARRLVVCDSSAYDFDVLQAARIALSATRQAEDSRTASDAASSTQERVVRADR